MPVTVKVIASKATQPELYDDAIVVAEAVRAAYGAQAFTDRKTLCDWFAQTLANPRLDLRTDSDGRMVQVSYVTKDIPRDSAAYTKALMLSIHVY